MIKHYFKIAVRNLARQKGLALINIAGLSIGIACFSLFLLYAVNEFSYDRFHTNASQIFRVYDWWDFKGKETRSGIEPNSSTPLGPAMKQDLPEVEDFVRFQAGWSAKQVRVGDRISNNKLSFADPQIFSVFTFPLLYGNSSSALKSPSGIVLTREKSLQLFGEANSIGRTLEIKMGDNYETFVVSGIAKDIPVNSSIKFDMLGSFEYVLSTEEGKASMDSWTMTIGITNFIKFRKGSSLEHDPARLAAFRKKYFADEGASLVKNGLWDGKGSFPSGIGLQPLHNIHTNTKIDQGAVNANNIWILIGIASGVLLIACINFTTLAIGRSAKRAKEVGMRKVMGGMKGQLARQFLAESLVLTMLSAIIGLLLAYLLMPFFNELAGTTLHLSLKQYPEFIYLLAGLILLVGLLSGSYPALVLSRFKPLEVLKNKVRVSGSNLFTRSLVTFQFVISIGLIIGTVVILQQLSYMHNNSLGFAKENVVAVSAGGVDSKKVFPLFKQSLQGEPAILGVTGSGMGLGAGEGQMGGRYKVGEKVESVIEYPVDHDYLRVMGMQLIAGRNFDPAILSDSSSSNWVIVNEALVKAFFGTSPDEAIGKTISMTKGRTGDKVIIGVTRNFNFEDLTREVRCQLFMPIGSKFPPSRFYARLRPGNPVQGLTKLEAAWKSLDPGVPFNYSFLDEKFDQFYKAEMRWSRIVGLAGGISIFLACLGLFGLAALAAVNRNKEIGIRKVMGATAISIVRLLSKDFLKLVLIALVIASPIAWYFANDWLQNYAFRINIGPWVFILTGIIATGVSLITIGLQGIKAALVNPVNSLRNE
jgi:putative ABC transport system permease protein